MIKKILKIFGILVGLLVLAIVLVPIIFKDEIIAKVKEEANNNLNAVVDFGEFDVTLLSSFPDLKLNIKDFSVVGKETFAGDTLTSVGELEVELDLMSVISGDVMEIHSIELIDPFIKLVVLEDGTANYDIALKSEENEIDTEEEEVTAEESGAFALNMSHYAVRNARFIMDDAPMQTFVDMCGLTHVGDGDFTQDNFILNTLTTIDQFTCEYEDVPYMNQVKTELKADLEMDMLNSKYTFKENALTLNNFHVAMDGFIAMPDDMEFDLKFNTSDSEFKYLLSLIPSVFKADMAGMDIQGGLEFDAYFKGPLTDDRFPTYGINIAIDNGLVQYTDLPKSIKDINIDFHMDNPTGHDDDVLIDLKRFYALLGDYVVDMNMKLTHPETDPHIDFGLQSQMDLSKIGDFMPLEEGESYKGNITANLKAAGNLSDIENEQYENFNAAGSITLLDFVYKTKDLPYSTNVKSAYLYFSPKNLKLSTLEGNIGNSDFKADGEIDNVMSYVLKDELLRGHFNFSSNKFDLNELMPEEEEEEVVEVTQEEVAENDTVSSEEFEVIMVPKNIDFVLNSSVKEIIYDEMNITNAVGVLEIKNGKVEFKDASMNMLDGELKLNGFYSTMDNEKPKMAFYMKIKDFDIPQSYKAFNTIEQMAPGAKYMEGKYSTELSLVSDFLPNMDLDYNTMAGNGKLQSNDVKLVNSPMFNKVADLTKYDKLKEASFKDVDLSYHFKDGKLIVDPFDVKLGKSKATIAGENSFDQTINYSMIVNIPSSELGGNVDALMNQFAGQLSSLTGQTVSTPSEFKFNVTAVGPYDNPDVKVKPMNLTGDDSTSVKDQLQQQVQEQVQEHVGEVIDNTKEEAIKKAKEEAAKIKAEAKKQADKVRAESKALSEKIKREGYKQADDLVKKAKTPIEKAAAKKAAEKMKKETDKKAKKILDEGNAKADKIEKDAEAKANKLIEEAEEHE